MKTRLDVCMECEASDHDGIRGGTLLCEYVVDHRQRAVPCRLRAMLSDPLAVCPHPDTEQARKWNTAGLASIGGCGQADTSPGVRHDPQSAQGVVRVADAVRDRVQLRVHACAGNPGHQPPCPFMRDGWRCEQIGRDVRPLLPSPQFACPVGRFAAEDVAR